MKIALYQPWIYQRGGMERVILEITSAASRHEWTIFTSHYDPNSTFKEFADRRVVELSRVPVRREAGELLAVTARIASQKLPLAGYDALLVSTAGFGEFITLRNHSLPTTCFCHTPLRVIHDPAARREFLHDRPAFKPAFMAFEAGYRALERRAWKRFSAVACNSLETKGRIMAAGLVASPASVTVVHPGVRYGAIKQSRRFGNYFLLPGRISSLKNVALGIEAFTQFRKSGGKAAAKFRLVIAGGVGEKDKPYFSQLKAAAASVPGVSFAENVSDGRLAGLYRGAYAVLFTALNEDWGIVPVEAMAFGKPIVAVNEGGPKESVEDRRTGFLVQPTPAAMAAAMRRLAASPALARRMGSAGRAHAAKFDWKGFINAIDGMVEHSARRAR